jgi:hypothetical protein
MARYPDFYAAKRQDVPDYARAAYLQATANSDKDEQNRQRYNDRNEGLGNLYQGVSDSMGEGKSPISEALRLGKAGLNKMRGTEQPMSSPGRTEMAGMQGPAPSSSPGRSAIADMLRSQPAPPPVRPSAPPQGSSSPGRSAMAQGNGLNLQKAMQNPTPVPIPPKQMGNPSMSGRGGPPQASLPPVGSTNGMESVSNTVTPASGPGLNAGSGALSALSTVANVATAPTQKDQIKAGVGGVGMTGLSTAGPALAAAGPVGWAGLAGLAAMSLYGMLG